jgi:hypothetical protein
VTTKDTGHRLTGAQLASLFEASHARNALDAIWFHVPR